MRSSILNRSRLGILAVVLIATSVAIGQVMTPTPGGARCGYENGCMGRPSYNACLNCCTANGCGTGNCGQACWNQYKRFRTPGAPVHPSA